MLNPRDTVLNYWAEELWFDRLEWASRKRAQLGLRCLGCVDSEATLAPLNVNLPLDLAELRLEEAVRARFQGLKLGSFGRRDRLEIFLRCSSLVLTPSIFVFYGLVVI